MKIVLNIALVLFLSFTNTFAKSKIDKKYLSEMIILTSQQKTLSAQLITEYSTKSKTTSKTIQTLEDGQVRLKAIIKDEEISNLLLFLNICLTEIKSTIKKPFSNENVQIVTDLSSSISEGSRYIADSF